MSDDLISRQAAIDAIVNSVSEIGLHDNSEVARYGATFRQHEIIDIIEGMPSAQRGIVRCRECRHAFINEYHEDKPLICGLTKMCGTTDPDWFCADGERRTE